MVINKELLDKRRKVSEHRPKFVRQESWRYDRLAENWRKPKGKDNKMRLQVSGVPSIVKVGYRGPKISRGLHPSGYIDRLVSNVNEVTTLNPKTQAARISHTVGQLKKKQMVSKASELGIKVLNPGKSDPNTKKTVKPKEAKK